MAKAPRVKNQHYVPQAILRQFQNAEGRIHVYDKWERKTYTTSTRNVASENGFYDATIGNEFVSRDPEMGQVEQANLCTIESILANRSLAGLEELQRWKLSHFFAVQFMRTKAAREMVRQVEEGLRASLPSKDLDESQMPEGFFFDEEQLKAQSVSNINIALRLAPHLLSKHWLLDSPAEGATFFISDNPLVKRNAHESSPFWSNAGIACPGMQIYMPLSPSLAVCLICDSLVAPFREIKEQYPEVSNPLIDFIDSGQPMEVPKETVIHQNSLQVAQSTRLIFSCTDDFSLIDEMLTTNPELAKPQYLEVR